MAELTVKEEAAMPKGVRGSGKSGQQALSAQELQAKRAELQAQLRELEAQDEQRFTAIGRAVEKHAESDQNFAQKLQEILERNVTDQRERVLLGLSPPPRARRGRPPKTAATPDPQAHEAAGVSGILGEKEGGKEDA